MNEKLFVNKTKFQLIKQGIGKATSRTFDNTKISNFRLLKKVELSKHPLAVNTFDYLGFGTEQKLINEVHGENRLAFDYEGKTIAFGQDL
jgi:hypothetical protein